MKIVVLWDITPFSVVHVYGVLVDPTASNDKAEEAKSISNPEGERPTLISI
jgi:hypothetical protein